MTIEYALIAGLLLHFIGDYITQNDWMATNKVKRHFPAVVHATVYSLPFLTVCDFWPWLIVIVTHFFIDRYRLAVYWIRFMNGRLVYEPGGLFLEFPDKSNCGRWPDKPVWMSTWLMIIVDNTFHIGFNFLAISLSH